MVKHKIEALLFSSGRKMSVEEISKLCKQKQDVVVRSLNELMDDYEKRNSSLMLVQEGNFWKITVREQHLGLVRNIVTETELSRSVIETLAVIAFKYPIKQCDLIKIRTNKAYEHLNELESSGYITRQKHGRTKLIKLTQKFFGYFDLPEEKLKDHFKDFESIARAIGEKEKEVEKIKVDQKKGAEDAKKEDEKIRQEISLLGAEEQIGPLEVYVQPESSEGKEPEALPVDILPDLEPEQKAVLAEEITEKEGSFEENPDKAEEITADSEEEIQETALKIKNISDEEFEKEIKKELSPEMKQKVEKEIYSMLNPHSQSEQENISPTNKKKDAPAEKDIDEDEPKDLIEAEIDEEEKKKEDN